MYNDSRFSEKPVAVGEVHGVEIISSGAKGDGVAKIKGFVIFIPNTRIGESVSVRITKVGRNAAFGEVVTP